MMAFLFNRQRPGAYLLVAALLLLLAQPLVIFLGQSQQFSQQQALQRMAAELLPLQRRIADIRLEALQQQLLIQQAVSQQPATTLADQSLTALRDRATRRGERLDQQVRGLNEALQGWTQSGNEQRHELGTRLQSLVFDINQLHQQLQDESIKLLRQVAAGQYQRQPGRADVLGQRLAELEQQLNTGLTRLHQSLQRQQQASAPTWQAQALSSAFIVAVIVSLLALALMAWIFRYWRPVAPLNVQLNNLLAGATNALPSNDNVDIASTLGSRAQQPFAQVEVNLNQFLLHSQAASTAAAAPQWTGQLLRADRSDAFQAHVAVISLPNKLTSAAALAAHNQLLSNIYQQLAGKGAWLQLRDAHTVIAVWPAREALDPAADTAAAVEHSMLTGLAGLLSATVGNSADETQDNSHLHIASGTGLLQLNRLGAGHFASWQAQGEVLKQVARLAQLAASYQVQWLADLQLDKTLQPDGLTAAQLQTVELDALVEPLWPDLLRVVQIQLVVNSATNQLACNDYFLQALRAWQRSNLPQAAAYLQDLKLMSGEGSLLDGPANALAERIENAVLPDESSGAFTWQQ